MSDTISRVTRSKSAARANYNRLSRWYDAIAGSTEAKYRQMGMDMLALQPGERLLEIGFGTGHCLVAFAHTTGADGFVCGIDLSDGMAIISRERADSEGIGKRVGIVVGDAVRIPFEQGCFDSIFMSFTLELFDTPEIPQVLENCRWLLRPQGRLALVTMAKTENPGLPEQIYEWFHKKMPVSVDCRPIFALPALEAAGFEIANVQAEMMWGLPVEIILAENPKT